MSEDAKKLLDLLASVNQLETRCKRIQAPVAVPAAVYELFDQLRAELARWGIDAFVESEKDR